MRSPVAMRIALRSHALFGTTQIAFEPLQTVMTHLHLPAPLVSKLTPIPSRLNVFTRSQVVGRDRFTLEGVLKSQEHSGYPEISPQIYAALEGQLSKTLKEYQNQCVNWMLQQEKLPGGLNSLFWEERQWAPGVDGSYFYSPQLGELRLERPPVVRGGLLCDEMGLGKTLEITALIVATLGDHIERPSEPRKRGDEITACSRASLIVVPDPLLQQWVDEISNSTTVELSVTKCTGQLLYDPRTGYKVPVEGDFVSHFPRCPPFVATFTACWVTVFGLCTLTLC